jgi:hypothetical protein
MVASERVTEADVGTAVSIVVELAVLVARVESEQYGVEVRGYSRSTLRPRTGALIPKWLPVRLLVGHDFTTLLTITPFTAA